MKCNVDIRKIGIKCEFNEGYELAIAKKRLLDFLNKNPDIRCKELDIENAFNTILITKDDIQIAKMTFGSYSTKLKKNKNLEKFYIYLEFEEPKIYDEIYEKDEDHYIYFMASNICKFLYVCDLEYYVQSITLNLKIPLKNELTYIISPVSKKGYKPIINNHRVIDDNFIQTFNFKTPLKDNETEIDLTLSKTYFPSTGLDKNNIVKLLKKEYLPIHLFEEEIELLPKNSRFHDKMFDCTFQELNKTRNIPYDFSRFYYFFETIGK